MPKPLAESRKLSEAATTTDAKSGRMSIQVMDAGWGTSGYYSPAVCEAGADLFAVGTHMYLDHPRADGSGLDVHGNRSVKDIAAVVTEAGRWDVDAQAVIAECQVTAPYREFLADENLAPFIGLSIRGSATETSIGEAEGRAGTIIEGLAAITSVDFVTRAGRGGRVLQVLESAPPSEVIDRAVARGVEEATADERRQQLSDAVRVAWAGPKSYAWVRDFDDTTVWFEADALDESSSTWAQTYTVADDDLGVTLIGMRTAVRPVTKYVTVTRPGSNNPTTTESIGDTVATKQIEESEFTRLSETAGRVDALLAESATKDARIKELEEADATRARLTRATEIVEAQATAAGVTFSPREVKGLLADITLTEAGVLDEAAFTKVVDTDAAAKKVTEGAGKVRGFGGDTTPVAEGDEPEIDLNKALAESGLIPAGTQVKEA